MKKQTEDLELHGDVEDEMASLHDNKRRRRALLAELNNALVPVAEAVDLANNGGIVYRSTAQDSREGFDRATEIIRELLREAHS